MSPTLTDPAAFRSVFADPAEQLILALADPDQTEEIARLCAVVESLRAGGTPAKLVVYGDSSAVLPRRSNVGFVELWGRPVLPPLLEIADAVVPLGKQVSGMLDDRHSRKVVRDPGRLGPLFAPRSRRTAARVVLWNDWGLGDELLLSAVAREIVRSHPGTQVWVRSRHGFRFPGYVQPGPAAPDAMPVETIYQNAVLYGPTHHSPFPGHLVQQMLDKVALDTGLRTTVADVRPELNVRPTSRTVEPTVVLHSGTNPRLPTKDWGVARWERLAHLLLSAGVRVRQVGAKDEPPLRGAEDLRGTAPCDLPEVFAESWATVSVVGFLMHLAEATRTPAVVIYGGREHPAIDGYPDQVHLSSGPLGCRGRWGCHLGPDLGCPHGMKCMEGLTPELVAKEVLSTLGTGGVR